MPESIQPQVPRRFDWGPTNDQSLDGVKEGAVYVVLMVLLGVCGWFLIDFDKAPPMVRPVEAPLPDAPTSTAMTGVAPQTGARPGSAAVGLPADPRAGQGAPPMEGAAAHATEAAAPPAFYVQLGAFGDEESARLAQERARKKGFMATLTPPNEQYEMFRLTIGPFADEAAAEKIARQLNELDFPCFVLESP